MAGPDTFGSIIETTCDQRNWQTLSVDGWINVRHAAAERPPAQGWKLHVSSTAVCADEVLRSALPALLDERATFKVARSRAALEALNQSDGGLSQVGKFLTV